MILFATQPYFVDVAGAGFVRAGRAGPRCHGDGAGGATGHGASAATLVGGSSAGETE